MPPTVTIFTNLALKQIDTKISICEDIFVKLNN